MSDNRRRTHSRRDFGIAAFGAASFATALTREATLLADESKDRDVSGWIDAHVHVWHPDIKKYPLKKDFEKSDMQPQSFTADELFSHCKPAGVNRIVLIQMSFYEYDHTYMCEMMDAHPGVFSGVALIDHRADGVAREMDELASKGMRGFRLHSHGDAKDWVDNPNMQTLWRKAGKDGLAVCPLINPTDIPYVDALCKKFPDTTVVVDHFARIGLSGTIESDYLDNLCRLARFQNTHVKTSAFYALGKKSPPYDDLGPMIRKVVDAFGPERLMWASDCPFQVQGNHSYGASIALIRDRVDFLSESDKQWLLRDTAEKVFFTT
jgi:predicted TIM-barrel fold metal-dependent hydrolase